MSTSITRFGRVVATSARLTSVQGIARMADGPKWVMLSPEMEPLLREPVSPIDLGRRRVARARHDVRGLQETAKKLIFGRIFGPADADRAEITSETELYLPFHRVELDVGGTALRFGSMRIGRVGVPIPFSQSRNEHVAVWVPAREEIPIRPQQRVRAPLIDATPFGAIDVPIAECTLDGDVIHSVVTSDVSREVALKRAELGAVHSVAPQNAVFGVGAMESVVSSHDVVLVPAFVVRYRYQGQALVEGGAFSVGLSAYTGKALWEEHPPAVRSALGKFRKVLSFG